jgi:hypothetical protein
MNDSFVEILGGLFPGDEVVTRGGYSLGFAGGGSVSLKAALDAAHGHEHNADGSEMTAGQKKEHAPEAGHEDHEHEGAFNKLTLFFAITTGLLFVLLLLTMLRKPRKDVVLTKATAKS